MADRESDRDFTIPQHLSAWGKNWVSGILDEAGEVITTTDFRLVILAAEASDRSTTARRQLGREGITYTDRFGSPKPHPAVSIDRDARAAFARLVAQLGLDNHDEPESSSRGRNSRYYRARRT
jgi:P27 family predicted phage terminase small subunit